MEWIRNIYYESAVNYSAVLQLFRMYKYALFPIIGVVRFLRIPKKKS